MLVEIFGELTTSQELGSSPSARRVLVEILGTKLLCMIVHSSPSARRVLVEMDDGVSRYLLKVGHPPRGGCWLKYSRTGRTHEAYRSPSARRVLVEIRNRSSNLPLPASPSARRVLVEILPD